MDLQRCSTKGIIYNLTISSQSIAEWKGIKAIAADVMAVGLREDGTVVASDEEADVSSWNNIVAIDTAGRAVVGLKMDGTVVVAEVPQSICDYDDVVKEWEDSCY